MRKLVVVLSLAVAVGTVAALPASASAPPAAARSDGGIRIVNLNLLHGVFCGNTNYCDGPDRVALLAREIQAAKCPDVVGLQEINAAHAALLKRVRTTLCGGRYRLAFTAPIRGIDTEQVLTTLPIKSKKVLRLSGGFRTASRVVLKAAFGTLVLVVTHSDGDPGPDKPVVGCTGTRCVPPCKTGTTAFVCQTIAAEAFAEQVGGPKAVRVFMGDFNFGSESPRYQSLISNGWVDSHLAAGNTECVRATGVNCTTGRDDQSLAALKDPTAKESERIDLILVKAPRKCVLAFDPVGDDDRDGLGTGLFAATPAVNGPGGLVWTSDHTAVSADFSCTKP